MLMRFPKISSQAIQPTILVLGFGWGVYTFVWQQYISKLLEQPRVEITPEIEDVGSTEDGLIHLDFKVLNPNLRDVYVGDSRWALYALRRRSDSVQESFDDRLKSFNRVPDSKQHVEWASIASRGQLLAVGTLFAHASLPSGFSRKESVLVKIPQNVRELNLVILFPHSFRKSLSRLGWTYRLNENGELTPRYCIKSVRNNGMHSQKNHCISPDSDRFGSGSTKGLYFFEFDASFALPVGSEGA